MYKSCTLCYLFLDSSNCFTRSIHCNNSFSASVLINGDEEARFFSSKFAATDLKCINNSYVSDKAVISYDISS